MIKVKRISLYDFAVLYLLFWSVLQDFILSIFYKFSSNATIVNLLFYTKDVIFITLFLISIFFKKNNRIYLNLVTSYFFIIVMSLFITVISTDLSINEILQNIRNIILLPCFCCIGYGIDKKESFIRLIINKYFPFLLICVIFGFIDYYLDIAVGTSNLWKNSIGLTNYYIDIKNQSAKMLFGLPGNFYGAYGVGYFSVKRLVSFWGNPLTAGYTLFVPLIYYFIKVFDHFKLYKLNIQTFKYIMAFLIIFYGVYLTKTRTILSLFLIIAFYYIFKNHKKNTAIFLMLFFSLIIILPTLNYGEFLKFMYDGSTIGHIEAVLISTEKMDWRLFGNGLGFAGTSGLVGTENSYLTLIGNIGISGCVVFLCLFLFPLYKGSYVKSLNSITKTIFYSGIGFFISGFISEQLFAFTTIAPYFVLLGILFNKKYSIAGGLHENLNN